MRILIAEDDPKLLKSLVHIFEINNYAVDGVTLLKKLRVKDITTPALFLTARTEIDQRLEGLDAGGDDYLPKPFSTGELVADTVSEFEPLAKDKGKAIIAAVDKSVTYHGDEALLYSLSVFLWTTRISDSRLYYEKARQTEVKLSAFT